MKIYVLRRLFQLLPILLANQAFLSFGMMRIAGSDVGGAEDGKYRQ